MGSSCAVTNFLALLNLTATLLTSASSHAGNVGRFRQSREEQQTLLAHSGTSRDKDHFSMAICNPDLYICVYMYIYMHTEKVCESNVSYFAMLAHDVRGGHW